MGKVCKKSWIVGIFLGVMLCVSGDNCRYAGGNERVPDNKWKDILL